MLERIDAGQGISSVTVGPPCNRGGATHAHVTAGADADAELVSRINLTAPPEDPRIVRRVRRMIVGGQLDNAENSRQAARNILALGV